MFELKDILYQLSINPGLFQECMNSLTDILSVAIREDWQLDEVADVIFEQVFSSQRQIHFFSAQNQSVHHDVWLVGW